MPDPLETERLILRNWKEQDRNLFFEINSDEDVMKFFPFRRNRHESDELMDKVNLLIEQNGFCFAAIELKETNQCVGFCGLNLCGHEVGLPKGTVEIGWRLAKRHWGRGYASETAEKWLEYAFVKLKLPEVVSFAVNTNLPSIAVMQRIGMKPDPERNFEHKGVSDDQAHLKPHALYSITQVDWLQAS